MIIGWPEGILLALLFTEICIHFGKHGEPRSPHNGGLRLFDAGLLLVILYWGGFFA